MKERKVTEESKQRTMSSGPLMAFRVFFWSGNSSPFMQSFIHPFVAFSINGNILSFNVSAPSLPLISVLSTIYLLLSSHESENPSDGLQSSLSHENAINFHFNPFFFLPDVHISFAVLHLLHCAFLHMHIQSTCDAHCEIPEQQSCF